MRQRHTHTMSGYLDSKSYDTEVTTGVARFPQRTAGVEWA